MASLPYPALCFACSHTQLLFASRSSIHAHILACSTASTTASSTSNNHQTGLIRHIAISGDDSHAATLGDDKTLCVYYLTSSLPVLLSTRRTIKRGSHVSFAVNNDIIVSDKVGDVYSYPLHPPPQDARASRPTATELVSDPSKNPDATLLLGDVSVITTHVITPDAKHIITADRDEHIRVSRYPKSYVVERYLLGSDGFVSALHIPPSRSTLLLSAGGEPVIRIWDWTNGVQVGAIEIWSEILPHRRVRSVMRKVKNPTKRVRLDPSERGDIEGFYIPPEGWLLPSGQGVCVKKIETVNLEDQEVVLFFSEGCAALHAFALPSEFSISPRIISLPLPYPLLDFTAIPAETGRLLLSLDTAWGTLKQNQDGAESGGRGAPPELSQNDVAGMSQSLVVVQVDKEGQLSDITSTASSSLSPLLTSLSSPSLSAPSTIVAGLNLYPDMSLLPRWPGFDEDEQLAGPEPGDNDPAVQSGGGMKKVWSHEEMAKMSLKQLGRLKASGVEVGDLLGRRRKEQRTKASYELDTKEKGDTVEVVRDDNA